MCCSLFLIHRDDIKRLHDQMLEAVCGAERHLSAQLLDIKLHNLTHFAEALEALGGWCVLGSWLEISYWFASYGGLLLNQQTPKAQTTNECTYVVEKSLLFGSIQHGC